METTLVSMYDPTINAFRQVTIEKAKRFIAEAKKLEKTINEIEKKPGK